MATESRRTLEERERLGDEVYDLRVRPTLGPEDENKYAAMDVVTGEFEIDPNDYTAVMRLLARIPEAEIWLTRVGWPATCRIGRGR